MSTTVRSNRKQASTTVRSNRKQAKKNPAPRSRLYQYPNLNKSIGKCCIDELEHALNQKRESESCLNPDKKLRDCTLEELEEQIRNVNERKSAEIYPNPDKLIRDCGIEEIEAQLQKAKEAKAAEPPRCHLPLISEEIFQGKIMVYLQRSDVARVVKTKEVSALFRLKDTFCAAHGVKLALEPLLGKRKRGEGESNDGSSQEIDESDWKRWKKQNPSPNPTKCTYCERAKDGLEYCMACKQVVKWDSFFKCVKCQKRICGNGGKTCRNLGDCWNCQKPVCISCGIYCYWCNDPICDRYGCITSQECRYCDKRLCNMSKIDCMANHLERHGYSDEPEDD